MAPIMNDNINEAVEKLQLLRDIVIESDKDIEFNIRVIDKAINFLKSDLPIEGWLDLQ